MVKFTTIIAFAIISISLNAQAPGYMGKKVSIGIDMPMIVTGYDIFDLAPNYSYRQPNPTGGGISYGNYDYSSIVFKYKPTLFIDYVLSRRTSIQVIARYFSSKTDVEPFELGPQTYYPSERVKTRSLSFGLRYKLYYQHGISPIGKYFSFGLEYATMNFFVDDTPFYNDQGKIGYPEDLSSFAVIPTFGMGTQRPISSSLIFNIGFEVGLPINFQPLATYNAPSDAWANNNSFRNFGQYYLINVNFGFSFAL